MLAFLRIRRRKSLDHQDHAVNEWRTKTIGQLLPDSFRLATFDTGCRLQMALGVKREWKKCDGGGKDDPGHPETAHMHETHDVIQIVIRDCLMRSKDSEEVRTNRYLNLLSCFPIGLGGSIRTFLLLGLLAAFQLGAADPRIGSWTLISAQSTLDPPNKLSITHLHDGVHVVMSGETHLDFTAKWKGHESSAPGNLGFNQIELHRIDKKQAEVKEKKDGAVVATVREKLSNDGNELTITTVSSGHADQITVWTRSGGAKVADDLFAGEWTQDLSKTRLRQGLVLKIESDGRGGVRFPGDFSYTARFDGKQYDLKNSRNDTVTLELVDPHTVDSIYRRDDQVAQKDRWVVSADGQQMTLTTTGTLETGQRVTEKLVFKRQ